MARLVEVSDAPKEKTYKLVPVEDEVAGASVVESLTQIPRQLGLTTRYIGEGLADSAGIFSDPLAGLSNKFLGTDLKSLRGATSSVMDKTGLPNPIGAQERVVGDASRMLAGTAGWIGGAQQGAKLATGTAQKALQSLAARPDMQAWSALGAGYAGGTAREQGLSPLGQAGAALAGGLFLPVTAGGIDYIGEKIGKTVKNFTSPQQIEIQIDNALAQAGIDKNTLSTQALMSLHDDVKKSIEIGNVVSPNALRRLADYRGVGATPMRGNLTLNPVDITRDKNLAKMGANSIDDVANQLPNIQYANNNALISGLNTLGADKADDVYGAGQKVISALDKRNDTAKYIIGSAYDKAKASSGRSAALDPSAFTNQANNALDEALLGGKLPSDVRNLLNKTAKGEMPLTVDTAEQFKTRIGDLQRASSDAAERMALGKVREALDNTPLLEGQGQPAIDAFNKARRINRAYMQIVEKTPALQAVRDGVEPDKFVNKFIIGSGEKSNVMDLAMLKKNIKGQPEAMQAVRGQILSHLKSKGVGAADEVANFSPAGYNKALEQIGERKLKLFFENSEIEQLKRIGRVASYENVQPKGSAVNNSNTAATAFASIIDGIGKYVPFGEAAIGKPAKNISISINSRYALNAPKALAQAQAKQQLPVPFYPMLAGSGLISAE